jgi:feruloyl esterase
MAAISSWVEKKQKPARIVASRRPEGKVVNTRLLCPFPQVARYSGSGDTADTASYSCAAAERR